jgi:DNA-binding beta-propeller fold protein YncE
MRELANCVAPMRWAGALLVATLASGCVIIIGDPPDQDFDAGPPPSPDASWPPPPPPPPPPPGEYKRVSMRPLYQLTPQAELGRFEIFGQHMTTADFQSPSTQVSVEQKLLEVGAQIGFERGEGQLNLFIDAENQTRAATIPFRANPSDVDVMYVDGAPKAFVPLGGGIGDPGNEVAVVNLDNGGVQRVRVGIHPQRIATHEPSGLAFVCNQYSSYISIIDARFEEPLFDGDEPVEVPTEFYCTDLLLVERDPVFGHPDELHLYVANEQRASVMRYAINIVRDINDDVADVEVLSPFGQPPNVPESEILGVGPNPYRLHLNEAQTQIYVANNRGGAVAMFDIASGSVLRNISINAPSIDIIQVADKVYVPTTTPFRGLASANAAVIPGELEGDPIEVTGLDGNTHVAHPGALFDDTNSYHFEDVRSGVVQINSNLSGSPDYHTDDNDADVFFAGVQKVLAGAVPSDITRTAQGDRVYVALLGSDIVQELVIGNGEFRLQPENGLIFPTAELPAAVALDESGGRLLVANRGADTLQIFDITNGSLLANLDLGYAQPQYPATIMEGGEYFFATAKWSNDGRKACASCHTDRFLTDGVAFAGGSASPVAVQQVKPMYNLLESDNYYWNGSFTNNGNASLAFAAQSRTNCETVLYGLVEGFDSVPAQRVGDPVNYTSGADDGFCRPNVNVLDEAGLPISLAGDVNGDGVENFRDIRDVIQSQQQLAYQAVGLAMQEPLQRLGRFDFNNGQANRDEVSRAIDYYTASELRLPPNPLTQMLELQMLPGDVEQQLLEGESLFVQASCDNCHDPGNDVVPFSDNREHGGGAGFIRDFIITYDQDLRLTSLDPLLANGVPDQMLQSSESDFTPQETNFHYTPIDYFMPFVFNEELVLTFDNPLAVRGSDLETERLIRVALLNLANPDGGFIPGQVIGQARVNTPSLRGVWLQHNLLRHGHARSVREAVLPPGHVALRDGEVGWAVDRRNNFNVHGDTIGLEPSQVDALELYVKSIE